MATVQKTAKTIDDNDAPPFVWCNEAKRQYRIATEMLANPSKDVPPDLAMSMIGTLLQASIAASDIAYNEMIGGMRA